MLQISGTQPNDIDKTILDIVQVTSQTDFTLASIQAQVAHIDGTISDMQANRAALVQKHNDAIISLNLNVAPIS